MTPRSSIAIRFTLVALFLWFGTMQLIGPAAWTSFLPSWTGYFPMPAEMFVRLNGWFEVVAATLLLIGCRTRVMAFLLGAHLTIIAASVGGAIGVRDAALGIITLAVAASTPDALTLDAAATHKAVPAIAAMLPRQG